MTENAKRIDIIATSISGAVSDWKKLDRLAREFESHYPGPSHVHIVDSHLEARDKTREVVENGGRIIVSAGGAGTFNSVLEGCHTTEGLPEDLRLAFLRKGSADLIGKVLKIPDDLTPAVRIISQSVEHDRTVQADVIQVSGNDPDGSEWARHFIGFGGVGVFGDIPSFTENRYIKMYKGFLGSLFGDRGPFIVGAGCALSKHHIDNLLRRTSRFILSVDNVEIPPQRYNSVIILNGDLGKDFPLATGMPLGDGYFQVFALGDRGFVASLRQLIHCWRGDILEHSEDLATQAFRIDNSLAITPEDSKCYMVNIDGLLAWAKGTTHYRISGRVRLITG